MIPGPLALQGGNAWFLEDASAERRMIGGSVGASYQQIGLEPLIVGSLRQDF